ncbi:MAG: GNAT family N-acetyltransferase [Kofleriaceae bacterium]
MRIASLDRSQLASARSVLASSCPFDRADVVADEKLFGLGPKGAPIAIGAWMSSDELAGTTSNAATGTPTGTAGGTAIGAVAGADARTASSASASSNVPAGYGGEVLVGIAALCADRIRVLAVSPQVRGRGVGSALLRACEDTARAAGVTTLRTLDEPGNYLAPGIDVRNTEAITWLERRGWQRSGELRENVLIKVRDNPRVTPERLATLVDTCAARGYEVRRARADEYALLDAVSSEFGGAWPFELARALEFAGASTTAMPAARPAASSAAMLGASSAATPGVHVALRDGAYCAFAAHDGNNAGLGWFGPTGTWPAHRGNGLGEAVLVACLVDVAAAHEYCEVAWIGPRPFYDKVAGVVSDRRFVLLTKTL